MGQLTTKSKTLSAAVDIFAARGYPESTVSLISKKAGVNIAAINYHFGSKETLFQEALIHSFELAEAKYPLRCPTALNPEDELRCFITALINRGFDQGPAGRIDQIICHELIREGGPRAHTIQELQKRQGEVLRPILGKLLQTRSKRLINQAHMNMAALCFFPKVARGLRKRLFPNTPSASQLQQYIDGQVAFALAGLSALNPTQTSQ